MDPGLGPPTFEEIVDELARVRVAGLVGLRATSVGVLSRAAVLAGFPHSRDSVPQAAEELLRTAVARLGGRLQEAAEYTFGLVPGTRDWPGQDRRKRAAECYRVSADRFRKHYEKMINAQLAEMIIGFATQSNQHPDQSGALCRKVATGRGAPSSVSIWHTSVDMVAGVDIVVCPTNVFLELAATYKKSIAACLRWAGAKKSTTGEILDDTVKARLDAWRAANTRIGHPVTAGTLVPLSLGDGGELRFQRIYHVAVAAPQAGTNQYTVDPVAVARAARKVIAVAREERRGAMPGLSSICFPLIGAGRGGLDPAECFTWMWGAITSELAGDNTWEVHFVAIEPDQAELIAKMVGQEDEGPRDTAR